MYTIEELDAAKCEFIEKIEAAGGEGLHEWDGKDLFFSYYRDITVYLGKRYISARISRSEHNAAIIWWDDENEKSSYITLEEFKNIKL